MKEVKSPKKPLIYYYGIVLVVIVLFNLFVTPTYRNIRDRSRLWQIHGYDSRIRDTKR